MLFQSKILLILEQVSVWLVGLPVLLVVQHYCKEEEKHNRFSAMHATNAVYNILNIECQVPPVIRSTVVWCCI